MKEKFGGIIDARLLFGFLSLEFLMLVVLKLVQTLYPSSFVDTFLMFGATVINAMFVLFLVFRVKSAQKASAFTGIPLAAFATLLADVFLVLAKDLASEGVISFISAYNAKLIGFSFFGAIQVIYAFHIGPTKRRLIIRGVFYIAFVAALYALDLLTLDRFIACLSMSQLILNLVFVWIDHAKKRTRASLLLALGITLFFFGDAFISVRMMLDMKTVAYAIVRFMVWVFYIPAQAVLTTSYLVDRADS